VLWGWSQREVFVYNAPQCGDGVIMNAKNVKVVLVVRGGEGGGEGGGGGGGGGGVVVVLEGGEGIYTWRLQERRMVSP